MGKAILICGKICSGKSTYAERLRTETKAVLLSVDEIMLELFGLYAGERHDEYTEKIQKYLFECRFEPPSEDEIHSHNSLTSNSLTQLIDI